MIYIFKYSEKVKYIILLTDSNYLYQHKKIHSTLDKKRLQE